MQCPLCASENSPSALRCSECDAPLPRIMTRSEVIALSVSPGRDVEVAEYGAENDARKDRVALYKTFLGAKSQAYYVRIFARFDREGEVSPSWNWAAFLMTLYWFLYRKMYGLAAIYFLFPWVVSFMVNALGQIFPGLTVLLGAIMLLVNLGVPFILIPLYANALYYWHCREHIEKIQASVAGHTEQSQALAKAGGTSLRAVGIAIAFMCVLATLIMVLVMPRYPEMLKRSHSGQPSLQQLFDKNK